MKDNIYIVVDGKPVNHIHCDDCNYCECETCPTWHGEEVEHEETET